jgi:hypothetical protein
VVEEFNKLEQEKSVKEYVDKLEKIKSLMSVLNSSLPKAYYVQFYKWTQGRHQAYVKDSQANYIIANL